MPFITFRASPNAPRSVEHFWTAMQPPSSTDRDVTINITKSALAPNAAGRLDSSNLGRKPVPGTDFHFKCAVKVPLHPMQVLHALRRTLDAGVPMQGPPSAFPPALSPVVRSLIAAE